MKANSSIDTTVSGMVMEGIHLQFWKVPDIMDFRFLGKTTVEDMYKLAKALLPM